MGIISLAELQALSPQTPLLVRRLPRGPRKSAVLSREVKMLAFATAALLVLATTAQAATEYNYGGRSSYEHGVYGSEYKPHEPRSAYKRYKRSAVEGLSVECKSALAGLSVECIEVCPPLKEEDCDIYCCDTAALPGEPGACPLALDLDKIDRLNLGFPCRDRSAAAGGKNFCYVSGLCKDARRSALHPDFMWSTDACCGNRPCPRVLNS